MAYRPASFRGVRFHVLEHNAETGKRLEVNEFHGRDTPYTESHGRKARRWSFRAFFLGSDAGLRALALRAACEAQGAGQLTLPTEGPQTVECESCRPSIAAESGRMVMIDLTFVEKGTAPGLIVTALAGAAALTAASSLVSVVTGIYATALAALDYLAPLVVDAAVVSVAGNMGRLYYTASDVPAQATSALAIADLRAAAAPSTAATSATIGLPVITTALRTAGAGADVFANPSAALPAVLEPEAACVADLVRRLFLIEEARALVARPLKSRDEADTLRAAFTARADAEIDVAAVARQADLLAGLRKLNAGVTRDLIDRGRTLPRLTTVTVARSLPAVVLAHRLWQDAGRAGELVAETGALHPGFMPLTVKALSA